LILFTLSARLGSFRLVVCSCCSPLCPFAFKRIKVNRAEWQQQQRHKVIRTKIFVPRLQTIRTTLCSLYVSSQEFFPIKTAPLFALQKIKIKLKKFGNSIDFDSRIFTFKRRPPFGAQIDGGKNLIFKKKKCSNRIA
jgi:hypothetical protein